ncbi:MAG TPA: peptidoglycan-associated lipoprotein Pal [Methylomirabilota bacterium]|nr:peptidoglycan-associated lipoprotein Pal [Methylomirabilota bacterium]
MSRRWSGMMVSLLVLAVIAAGCAKKPATMQAASAPAPTGAAGRAVEAPAGGPASSTGAQMQPGDAKPAPSGVTAPPVGGARPAPKEFTAVPDLRDVYFDFDKYDIRPADAKTLDSSGAWLKTNGAMLLLIEGHCDERGTNDYNLALGERRAKAAMNYLVSQGVQASRITIISYGEERPVCSEKNEACWAKNRRAHFLVKPR